MLGFDNRQRTPYALCLCALVAIFLPRRRKDAKCDIHRSVLFFYELKF
jgi:hypothetical protein